MSVEWRFGAEHHHGARAWRRKRRGPTNLEQQVVSVTESHQAVQMVLAPGAVAEFADRRDVVDLEVAGLGTQDAAVEIAPQRRRTGDRPQVVLRVRVTTGGGAP